MAMLNRIRRKRFGEILVNEGIITKEQLQEATEIQRSSGDFLGTILLELGHVTETDIIKTMSVQYQLPFIRPSLYDLDRKLVQKFKPDFLHLHKILPIGSIGNLLLLVVTDIPSEEVLAEIQETSEANLAIYIGAISEVDQILKEMAPVSEEEDDRIRRRRRGGLGAQAMSLEDPAYDSTQVKKEVVLTVDTSWESIFDQAEGKVKGPEEDQE